MAVNKYAMPWKVSQGPWTGNTAETINQLFERLYRVVRIGADALDDIGALANHLDLIVPAVGSMIVCTTAGIFVALPIVTTAQRVVTNNGGIPTWAQVDLTTGVTGLLPFANLVNASATKVLVGRNSAGSGVYQEVTLSQLLDWIGVAAQGDVLYRGAATWARLAAGTSGQFLQTGGATGNPAWATPTAVGSIADLIQQNFFFIQGRPSTLSLMGLGGATQSTAGTIGIAAVLTSAGSFVNFVQTGTTAGLRAGFDMSRFDFLETDSDPTFEVVLRTPATMTNIRIWIGLANAGLSVNGDDQGGTSQYMAFRYSSVVPDPGWVGVMRDGTTQSVTANVANIAASTVYKLKIRKSGSSIFFSVNGGAEITATSNPPAATTALGPSLHVYNSVNSTTHAWDFGRLRCLYGS